MNKPFLGISAYAAPAWDKQTKAAFFKCFPKGCRRPAVALLWASFGDPTRFAKRFIEWAGDRNHLVEIHISNECARRSGRQGGQICPELNVAQYDKALRQRDERVIRQVRKRVDMIFNKVAPFCTVKTKLMFSIGLEDNLSDEAAAVILEQRYPIPSVLPLKFIRNPMTQRPSVGCWSERHGRNIGGTEVHNFDGVHVGSHPKVEDIGYANAVKLIKEHPGYKALFLWSAYAQGWEKSGQPYTGRTYVISEEEQAGFSQILREIQK